VRTAIKRLHTGEYEIVRRPEGYVPATEVEEEEVVEEPIDFKKMFAEEDDADEENA
jgi:hypothetical protein